MTSEQLDAMLRAWYAGADVSAPIYAHYKAEFKRTLSRRMRAVANFPGITKGNLLDRLLDLLSQAMVTVPETPLDNPTAYVHSFLAKAAPQLKAEEKKKRFLGSRNEDGLRLRRPGEVSEPKTRVNPHAEAKRRSLTINDLSEEFKRASLPFKLPKPRGAKRKEEAASRELCEADKEHMTLLQEELPRMLEQARAAKDEFDFKVISIAVALTCNPAAIAAGIGNGVTERQVIGVLKRHFMKTKKRGHRKTASKKTKKRGHRKTA